MEDRAFQMVVDFIGKGNTQREVAKRCGVSEQVVGNWLKAKKIPRGRQKAVITMLIPPSAPFFEAKLSNI